VSWHLVSFGENLPRRCVGNAWWISCACVLSASNLLWHLKFSLIYTSSNGRDAQRKYLISTFSKRWPITLPCSRKSQLSLKLKPLDFTMCCSLYTTLLIHVCYGGLIFMRYQPHRHIQLSVSLMSGKTVSLWCWNILSSWRHLSYVCGVETGVFWQFGCSDTPPYSETFVQMKAMLRYTMLLLFWDRLVLLQNLFL